MIPVLNFKPSQQDFVSSMLPQRCALPYNFMGYIEKNQNAKVYDKLIKTCKYFFYSKGFVVVVDVCDPIHNTLGYLGGEYKLQQDLREKWLNQRRKIWIHKSFSLCSMFFLSAFYPLNSYIGMLYPFDNISLALRNQPLKYEELKTLSEVGTFKEISISTCSIFDENGIEVLLEDIIALFPNVEKFRMSDNKLQCSENTAKALTTFSNLKRLILWGIPAVFNIDDFTIFVKTHGTDEYFISFDTDAPATYVFDFRNAINAVCTNWDLDSKPPYFHFYTH